MHSSSTHYRVSLFVSATTTCTVFHSISVACYCVLRSWGIGCLDHSLPLSTFNRNKLQGVPDVGAGKKAVWNEKRGRWIRALQRLVYPVSNVNNFLQKNSSFKGASHAKLYSGGKQGCGALVKTRWHRFRSSLFS